MQKETSNALLNTLLDRAHSNAAYAMVLNTILPYRFYPLSLINL